MIYRKVFCVYRDISIPFQRVLTYDWNSIFHRCARFPIPHVDPDDHDANQYDDADGCYWNNRTITEQQLLHHPTSIQPEIIGVFNIWLHILQVYAICRFRVWLFLICKNFVRRLYFNVFKTSVWAYLICIQPK